MTGTARRSGLLILMAYASGAVLLEQLVDLLLHLLVPGFGGVQIPSQVQDAVVFFAVSLAFGMGLRRELLRRARAEESLRGAVAELQATQRGLEQAVAQRTAELAEANGNLEAKITEQALGAAELRMQQAQLASLLEERSALLDISRSLTTTLELQPLLSLILDQIRPLISYVSAAVFLQEGENLIALEYRGPGTFELLRTAAPVSDAPLYLEIVRRRAPVIIGDLDGDEVLARAYREHAGSLFKEALGPTRSWLGVPLIAREHVIGLLRFGHDAPNYYSSRHAQLGLAVANQAAAAIENARLYGSAQRAAKLEERQRLAREIHDSVSQALYGIVLGARTARTLLERDRDQVAAPLDYVLSLAENGIADMRTLIHELRPEGMTEEGLVPALRGRAGVLSAQYGLPVDLETCSEPQAPLEVKQALLRIAQEALYNVTRHAHASLARLRLSQDGQDIVLEVADDGIGFDPASGFPGHLGLQSMRERAARLGGTLQIESLPEHGTCVRACVPLSGTAIPLADLIL